jgi:LPPG:FO 2-phospho-L-lactate transferase
MIKRAQSSEGAPASGSSGHVLALCGGIGGAKLALGLYRVLPPHALTVVVNTGDDFEHLGLHISPDLDTVLYTLAGWSDPVRGWGRADETWHFMEALELLGGPQWFRLGDRDLAMHVERTERLKRGETLTAFARRAVEVMGIVAQVVPMSDDPVRTILDTDEGPLAFQNYFVERRCEPVVTSISFVGSERACPSPAFLHALARTDLEAIVICPSNPYLSIDPLLSVPGVRVALSAASAPVMAVSPLIGGQAVKGPTAKIMMELGISATPQAIVEHYRDLLHALVIDNSDVNDSAHLDIPTEVTSTLMRDMDDRRRLAREVLNFAERIAATRAASAGPHIRRQSIAGITP